MNNLINVLSNLELPDFNGVDNLKDAFTTTDKTWIKSAIDYAGTCIADGMGGWFKNFGMWMVQTGHTLSYWLCTLGGMYCTEKYAMTRDRTCINKFSKLFLIYLFLTLLCTLL